MSQIINGYIELNKLLENQNKISDKNGRQFINVSIYIDDTVNKFGQDCSIQLSQNEEERNAKATKVYVGNGKTVYNSTGKTAIQKEPRQ